MPKKVWSRPNFYASHTIICNLSVSLSINELLPQGRTNWDKTLRGLPMRCLKVLDLLLGKEKVALFIFTTVGHFVWSHEFFMFPVMVHKQH